MYSRLSRVLPVSVAVLAVLAFAASTLGGTPDQDRFTRRGRGGSPRLDSVDAIPHSHEISEPDSTDWGGRSSRQCRAARYRRTGPRVSCRQPIRLRTGTREPSRPCSSGSIAFHRTPAARPRPRAPPRLSTLLGRSCLRRAPDSARESRARGVAQSPDVRAGDPWSPVNVRPPQRRSRCFGGRSSWLNPAKSHVARSLN